MSRTGLVTLAWGDGEYQFRLGYRELMQLQEICDAGPPRIAARLQPYDGERNPHGDNWKVQDIRDTIRLGLIGAGRPASEVPGLLMKFVDAVPLMENRLVAWAVIQGAVIGTADEPLGKAAGAAKATKARSSRTTKLPSGVSSASPV